MTTPKNDEATTAQPVEQNAPQAGQDDQPLSLSSDISHSQFMARVAKSKAKVEAMSQEERYAHLGMGGPSEGVGPAEAMRRLEEIESGRYDNYDNDSEEDDEAGKSGGAEGGKPEVTDDKQDGKDKTSSEAGGAQDDKEKAAKEKQG